MTYPSLEAFYAGDRRRRASRERDVGLFWRGRGGATYRAAWVQATGELYVLEHGRPHCRGGFLRVVGSYGARELEQSFAGWRDVCGRARSIDWLLDRTQSSSASLRASARASGRRGTPRSPWPDRRGCRP